MWRVNVHRLPRLTRGRCPDPFCDTKDMYLESVSSPGIYSTLSGSPKNAWPNLLTDENDPE